MKTVVLGLVLLTACASGGVRQLRRDDAGGAYALEGDEGKARAALTQAMTRHCGADNFEEVPPAEGAAPGEVAYRCKTAPAKPAAGPASGGGGDIGY